MPPGDTPQLTLLGTGTPAPVPHRAGASYLLALAHTTLLIDCGPGCVDRLVQKGVSLTTIDTVVFTHLHFDHCVDLARLILVRWDQAAGQCDELNIFGPAGTQHMIDRLIGDDGAFAADLAARTQHPVSQHVYEMRGGTLPRTRPAPRVTELRPGEAAEGDGWKLRSAAMVHAEPQLITLAYRIEAVGCAIVFGADTGPTPRLIELARDADVLIHMCHFYAKPDTDPREAASCSSHLDAVATARQARVATLVLTHIPPALERGDTLQRLLKDVQERCHCKVVLGSDLLSVPIPCQTDVAP